MGSPLRPEAWHSWSILSSKMRTQYNKACVAYCYWLIVYAWQPQLLNDWPPSLVALNVIGPDVAEHSRGPSRRGSRAWPGAGADPPFRRALGGGRDPLTCGSFLRFDNEILTKVSI